MNHDIELQVWKDLATSKQILITAIIETLGMDSDCTSGDLRLAINLLMERVETANTTVEEYKLRAQHAEDVNVLAIADQLKAEEKLTIAQKLSAETLVKAKEIVLEKKKELKAISKALSDSPENVVKKMKKLKQKNIEQTKHMKDIEKKFKEAVQLCEKLRIEIENRVVENKQLKSEVNKLVDPTPKPSDNNDSI